MRQQPESLGYGLRMPPPVVERCEQRLRATTFAASRRAIRVAPSRRCRTDYRRRPRYVMTMFDWVTRQRLDASGELQQK